MIFNHCARLTPQQKYEIGIFIQNVNKRQLRTNDLRYILVLLRECTRESDFKEWGSAIAHIQRDRGWLFTNVISIWATHIYYEYLDRRDIRLSPLPAEIIDAIVSHVECLSSREIYDRYGHILSPGITADEIIATIDHLYSRPSSRNKKREAEAFYHFSSEGGIEESDALLLRLLIIEVEDKALAFRSRPLSEIVSSIEIALNNLGFGDGLFNKDDLDYLQLHILVAFHAQIINVCPKTFFDLTGRSLRIHQIIVFVSSMEEVLTLDIGFFECDENGNFQPATIRAPYSPFNCESCYYPIVASDLRTTEWLAETDENVRYNLYSHPLKVVRRKGSFWIVAGPCEPDQSWFMNPNIIAHCD